MVFRGQKLRESNNQINFDRSTKNHAFLRCPTYRRFRGKLKWRWHSGHSISISYQTLSEPRYVYIMQLYWLFFLFFFLYLFWKMGLWATDCCEPRLWTFENGEFDYIIWFSYVIFIIVMYLSLIQLRVWVLRKWSIWIIFGVLWK